MIFNCKISYYRNSIRIYWIFQFYEEEKGDQYLTDDSNHKCRFIVMDNN
jgi:hypothetical protein